MYTSSQHSNRPITDLLLRYDPALPVRLSTDASYYDLGAVISNVLLSGVERL